MTTTTTPTRDDVEVARTALRLLATADHRPTCDCVDCVEVGVFALMEGTPTAALALCRQVLAENPAAAAAAAIDNARHRLAAAVAKDNGATVDPSTLAPLAANVGFVVGLVQGTAATIPVGADPTKLAALVRHVGAVYRAPLVGLWRNGDRVEVDPVEVLPTLAQALAAGRARGQLAVFDLATAEVVPCK